MSDYIPLLGFRMTRSCLVQSPKSRLSKSDHGFFCDWFEVLVAPNSSSDSDWPYLEPLLTIGVHKPNNGESTGKEMETRFM